MGFYLVSGFVCFWIMAIDLIIGDNLVTSAKCIVTLKRRLQVTTPGLVSTPAGRCRVDTGTDAGSYGCLYNWTGVVGSTCVTICTTFDVASEFAALQQPRLTWGFEAWDK